MRRHRELLGWSILAVLVITVGFFGFLSFREQRRLTAQDRLPTTPSVLPGDPARGPAGAAVTIIEYGDYQCAFCRLVEPELARLLRAYPQQLRLVWKDFPLTDQHDEALQAAQAARCAGEQGAFWEMHDALLRQEHGFSSTVYGQLAQEIHLDQRQFQSCVKNPRVAETIRQSAQAAVQYGIDGTPYFFINGTRLSNVTSAKALSRIIQQYIP